MPPIETPIDALLPGLVLHAPARFGDARGAFREVWNTGRAAPMGLPVAFAQVNHSSSARGVLRGLHFQRRHPQGKLVTVVTGAIWDVAVDLRAGSPTFGQHSAAVLSAENGRQLYLPPGFAHGFLTLSERADVIYLATDVYHPEDEGAVRYDDPTLALPWPLEGPPVVSAKDAAAPMLAALRPAELPTP